MIGGSSEGASDSSFSLVAYLPPPLAGYLESLRAELVAGCTARAHVTILPPRPLPCAHQRACSELYQSLLEFPVFPVMLGEVCVFPESEVVFLSIREGARQLIELHRMANVGVTQFQDEFSFHPHVTLAQRLAPGAMPAARDLAARAWSRYTGPRSFLVEKLVLVRKDPEGDWKDVAEFPLTAPVSA